MSLDHDYAELGPDLDHPLMDDELEIRFEEEVRRQEQEDGLSVWDTAW